MTETKMGMEQGQEIWQLLKARKGQEAYSP